MRSDSYPTKRAMSIWKSRVQNAASRTLNIERDNHTHFAVILRLRERTGIDFSRCPLGLSVYSQKSLALHPIL